MATVGARRTRSDDVVKGDVIHRRKADRRSSSIVSTCYLSSAASLTALKRYAVQTIVALDSPIGGLYICLCQYVGIVTRLKSAVHGNNTSFGLHLNDTVIPMCQCGIWYFDDASYFILFFSL